MRTYRVVVTDEAMLQMKEYLSYLKNDLANPQAAKSLRDDWKETRESLSVIAGSIGEPDNEKLVMRNLKKMHFKRHAYVMLFRLNGDIVEVVNIYHDLQNYEQFS